MIDAYDIIGDLAHEDPRIADAVLAWRRKRVNGTVRATSGAATDGETGMRSDTGRTMAKLCDESH